jgi:hypothetical protein
VLSGGNIAGSTIGSSATLFAPLVTRDQAVLGATRTSTATLFVPSVGLLAAKTVTGATCASTAQLFVPDVGLAVGLTVTQVAVETLTTLLTSPASVTQLVVETVNPLTRSPVVATQVAAEFLFIPGSDAHVTQLACELIVILTECGEVIFPIDPD